MTYFSGETYRDYLAFGASCFCAPFLACGACLSGRASGLFSFYFSSLSSSDFSSDLCVFFFLSVRL